METLWLDIRLGFRSLWKSRAFLAVSILSLALGIGANTAIFTLVKAVFLQPLPFRDPHRLVALSTVDQQSSSLMPSAYPTLSDVREYATSFDAMAVTKAVTLIVSKGSPETETWNSEIVSDNFFDVLGVQPLLGRVFTSQDEGESGDAPIVLSYGAWNMEFAAGRNILGRTLTVNRRNFTVIGVMPSGFKGVNGLYEPAAWIPMTAAAFVLPKPEALKERRLLYFSAYARLKEGVSVGQANASLEPLARKLASDFPEVQKDRSFRVSPVAEVMISPGFRAVLERSALVLFAAVTVVLWVSCANVASLLLVRAKARGKEFAVRQAMGAGSWRIARQMLTESLLLFLMGGAAGLVAARWARDLLWRFRPPWMDGRAFDISFDWRVLVFALACSLVTGVVFGLAPALVAVKRDLATGLRERAASLIREHRVLSLRSILVTGQCALSVVAMVGAGLFIESLRRLYQVDPGMIADRLVAMRMNNAALGLGKDAALDFYDRAVERVLGIPSVKAAALSTIHPFSMGGFLRGTRPEGMDPAANPVNVLTNMVGPRYFETTGVRLLEGREFTPADRQDAPFVVIVNESAARRFWPDASAVGKRLRFRQDTGFRQVVGIVKDNRFFSLNEKIWPCIYIPYRQEYLPDVSLLVQSAGDPKAVTGSLRAVVQSLDRNLVAGGITNVEALIRRTLWAQRLVAGLLAAFGILALVLSATGFYGLTSYAVSQRTGEIGLRMALGAQRGDVLRQVVGRSMMLVSPGLLIGVAASLASTRVASSLLYSINAAYPPVYLIAGLILAIVALLACYLPARRASKVDPMLALRHE